MIKPPPAYFPCGRIRSLPEGSNIRELLSDDMIGWGVCHQCSHEVWYNELAFERFFHVLGHFDGFHCEDCHDTRFYGPFLPIRPGEDF